MKTLIFIILNLFYSLMVFAQDKPAPKEPVTKSFSFLVDVLGSKGLLAAIGLLFFGVTYRYSQKLFAWIEDQTYGTRDYILQKFEIMHIEVAPTRVTIALLSVSFGFGFFVFGIFAFFGMFLGGALLGGVLAFIGWKLPKPIVDYMEQRRVKLYQTQMVDALNLLANGIRAGLSMPQAVGMVVDEMPAPVSQEFNLILQQAKIGVPLEEALENLNKRVKTQDNEMFVTSVNILRETGGNLAEVFDTIVFVIRERVRLQQKIETYVAQGMFQGLVIFAMPYAQIAINGSSDPDYLRVLFTTPLGIIMFILIVALSCTGFWIITKVVTIKI
ncbi:MAG: type II secretion system F family protein [Bacteriovoracaceae bacterium]|nr:type II secretion system F family protein [Bacteriovoracaceae bacterium]